MNKEWYRKRYRTEARQKWIKKYTSTDEFKRRKKEHDKKYYQKNKERLRVKTRKARNKWHKKYKQTAIGKLKSRAREYARRNNQKSDKCFQCSSTQNLEFHHTNYEKFEGITLCRKCHKAMPVIKRIL